MADPSPRPGPVAAASVPARTLRAILDHCAGRLPLLGGGRLIAIDGFAGSGKTTLAAALLPAARARGWTTAVVHTDDVLLGWGGLRSLGPRLRNYLVGPLASGHPARMRQWDWHADAPGGWLAVGPVDLLVLEGVGSAGPHTRSRCATAVWVDAPQRLRLERGIARDGEAMRGHWEAWLADEAALADNAGHCQLRVDARGRLLAPASADSRSGVMDRR